VLKLYINQIYSRKRHIVAGFYTVDNLKTFYTLSISSTASNYIPPRLITDKKSVKYKHLAVTSYVIIIGNVVKDHNI
jgi:hypothetical protein